MLLGEPGFAPKVVITHGQLPKTIDPKQPPHVKVPFSTILSQHWSHTIEVVLSEDLHDVVWNDLESRVKNVQFSKVFMPLIALLEGDFFNMYIKSGNVEMLSEGRSGVDNLFSFRQGVLRLELPKEVYERAGLVGKPIPDGGRKHMKNRFGKSLSIMAAIEIDLRQPSMVRGKKGFERILWAVKNVLTDTVTWLFVDRNEEATLARDGPPPISTHHPLTKIISPETTHHTDLITPPMQSLSSNTLASVVEEEDALDILEWLGLVSLQSPRIQVQDRIDPYLSRYSIPGAESAVRTEVVTIKWQGFMPGEWTRDLFVACLQATESRPSSWFALTASAFRTEAVNSKDGYTILRLPSSAEDVAMDLEDGQPALGEYLLWEMINGSNGM